MTNQVKVENFMLVNGVRLLLIDIPYLNSLVSQVLVKTGAAIEEKGEFGLSHVLEHMAFKGTKKRPRAIDINKEIDSKGAEFGASTGYEYTSYYIETVRDNLGWSIEILSDILTESLYKEDELEKEKGVIIEEIRMYKDNPSMGLFFEFANFIWPNSQKGCWSISGEVSDITTVNRDKLVQYSMRNIVGENMVVVLAGNIYKKGTGSEELVRLMERYFGKIKRGKLSSEITRPTLSTIMSKRIDKQIEQAHYCLGFESFGRRSDKIYAQRLLGNILAGNSSSRLFEKIREDRGWAYYLFLIDEELSDFGIMGLQAGVNMERLKDALELTRREFLEVGGNVCSEELERVKQSLIARTQLKKDKVKFWSNFIGYEFLLESKIKDIEKEIEKYSQVNLKQIKDIANELFCSEKIRIVSTY